MADKRRFNIKERKGIYTEGGGVKSSVKIVNGGLDFHFHFYFYFSIFRTTQVRVYQSRCHISHKLMA